ncbi:hypothetical protein Micbo1qcDRAFT_220838 [Microdochium bolleyi]|uniref:Uncharacterized protein n=1 Tax=Microdochium bolleyi TaxID=196109 RepID=A0A136JAN8_9PEZI|nr:hypothetical protein Micbo1qcDRAFT_220838 [Microdochium bolleyi]
MQVHPRQQVALQPHECPKRWMLMTTCGSDECWHQFEPCMGAKRSTAGFDHGLCQEEVVYCVRRTEDYFGDRPPGHTVVCMGQGTKNTCRNTAHSTPAKQPALAPPRNGAIGGTAVATHKDNSVAAGTGLAIWSSDGSRQSCDAAHACVSSWVRSRQRQVRGDDDAVPGLRDSKSDRQRHALEGAILWHDAPVMACVSRDGPPVTGGGSPTPKRSFPRFAPARPMPAAGQWATAQNAQHCSLSLAACTPWASKRRPAVLLAVSSSVELQWHGTTAQACKDGKSLPGGALRQQGVG